MLEGMCISYSKVQSLNERPIPTKVKQVQSFLVFLQYSHKLIHNFSTISEPLHKLTCKNKSFAWTVLCQSTFEEIMRRVVSVPMLKTYNGSTKT